MTAATAADIEKLAAVGRIVGNALRAMGAALRPGLTTGELDAMGRSLLEREGARPAPELCYGFPGATCISVGHEVAHGVPGARVLAAGDLVNIDVSAEKDGYFADTGGSFPVGGVPAAVLALCRDGRRAMWEGIRAVRVGAPYAAIGRRVEGFARRNGYTLIRNLASHGVGRALHEEPGSIATWEVGDDRRVIREGDVFTIEPFLSRGAHWAEMRPDGWTLVSEPAAPTVQYEHTLVATRRGPLVLTRPH